MPFFALVEKQLNPIYLVRNRNGLAIRFFYHYDDFINCYIVEIRQEVFITLKISIEESESKNEIEVLIKCRKKNEKVDKLISAIQLSSLTIIGRSEGITYFLLLEDVLYIDTVDEKVFLYTSDKVYETNLRLYEIEEMSLHTGMIRVNKSTIMNLIKVDHVSPMLNGRIQAVLINGETIIISRQYVRNFKKKLGI